MLQLFLGLIETESGKIKFEKIYYKYHDFLLNVAQSVTVVFYDAEDALQNALFKIAIEIDNIMTDDEYKLKSFLRVVVQNAAKDLVRKRIKTSFSNIDMLQVETDGGFDKIEKKELHEYVVRSVANMPSIYREVMVLNYVHDLPPKKIASVLSLSINTVNSRLRRGRKIIEELLRNEYFAD